MFAGRRRRERFALRRFRTFAASGQFPAGGFPARVEEIAVKAGAFSQLCVRAALHDPALVQNEDLVGLTHGLETVRDHQNGLILRERFHGLL